MDSLTHILLGGALAQVVAGRRAGMVRSFLVGAAAATLPDLDVFIQTGNVVRDHALHRHFTHSLAFVPLLAVVAWALFMMSRKGRAVARPLFEGSLAACASHTILDALTSYGTVMLWPLSERRIALDIVAVIDPLVTLPLLAGLAAAFWKRTARGAAIGLAVAGLYMGFAFVQHERAAGVQRQLLAARGVTDPVNARVLPQLGAVVLYRSLYIHEGRIYADAIRPGGWGQARVKPGGSLPVIDVTDLRPFPAPAPMVRDFDRFHWFSDGYVARSPREPGILTDLRYALAPEGVESVWGVRLEERAEPLWVMQVRWGYTRRLVTEIFHPKGYVPLASLGNAP